MAEVHFGGECANRNYQYRAECAPDPAASGPGFDPPNSRCGACCLFAAAVLVPESLSRGHVGQFPRRPIHGKGVPRVVVPVSGYAAGILSPLVWKRPLETEAGAWNYFLLENGKKF